jgi:hypothetical protein
VGNTRDGKYIPALSVARNHAFMHVMEFGSERTKQTPITTQIHTEHSLANSPTVAPQTLAENLPLLTVNLSNLTL